MHYHNVVLSFQMVDLMNCELSDKTTRIEELERCQTAAAAAGDKPAKSPDTCSKHMQTDGEFVSKQQISTLQEQVTEKNSEITALSSKLADAQSIVKAKQEQISSLETQVVSLKKSLQDSQLEREESDTSIGHLQAQLQQRTADLTALRNTADLNAAMKERLHHLELEAQQAKDDVIAQSKRHQREMSQLQERLVENEQVLLTKDMDLTQRGTEIFEILEKRTELEAEVARLQSSSAKQIVEQRTELEAKLAELQSSSDIEIQSLKGLHIQ